MGLFRRNQTPPEGAGLEDIANHWKKVDKGQAGKDIKEMEEFHKPWWEGAIGSMAAGQSPAVAIAGGSNGGGKTGPDAGTLPESRRIRDALFFDITGAYSQWRQKRQERRYKPSMGINLLPSKKELKSYSKAKEAYLDGNIGRAERILEDAGCGSGTIGESCERWHQLRLRHVKVSPEPEMEPEPVVKEKVPWLVYTAERYSGTAERNRPDKLRYAVVGLLGLGALAGAGSIGYEYVVKPHFSQQVSVERPTPAKGVQQKQAPVAISAAPKREPSAPAAPEQQKPTFHSPIAPPAAQPGTTEPRTNVQQPAAPTAAPERPPAPAQPRAGTPAQPARPAPEPPAPVPAQKQQPSGMPTYFTYENVYGEKQRIPIRASRWLIDSIGGEPDLNSEILLLNTFYDNNRNKRQEWFEPSLPVYVKLEKSDKGAYVNMSKDLKRGKQIYLMFTENAAIDPIKDELGNIVRIEIPSSYLKFLQE